MGLGSSMDFFVVHPFNGDLVNLKVKSQSGLCVNVVDRIYGDANADVKLQECSPLEDGQTLLIPLPFSSGPTRPRNSSDIDTSCCPCFSPLHACPGSQL